MARSLDLDALLSGSVYRVAQNQGPGARLDDNSGESVTTDFVLLQSSLRLALDEDTGLGTAVDTIAAYDWIGGGTLDDHAIRTTARDVALDQFETTSENADGMPV